MRLLDLAYALNLIPVIRNRTPTFELLFHCDLGT